VGNNKSSVVATGPPNLTTDGAPVLIHLRKDRTQRWLLVLLTNPDAEQSEN